MWPEGIILVNPPIATFQQSLTHSAMFAKFAPKKVDTIATIGGYFPFIFKVHPVNEDRIFWGDMVGGGSGSQNPMILPPGDLR